MTAYLAILIALIGLILYAISNNGKVQEAGRIAYFCGLLAFLLQVGSGVVRLF